MHHATCTLHTRAAKRRAKRRAKSAGTVIFIVAMTLVVLGSMGMYAMRAASTDILTSGYSRQATQTHYITEYGILGGAQQVRGAKAQLYLQMMQSSALQDFSCPSLVAVPATAQSESLECRRMAAAEVGAQWTPLNSAVPYASPFEPYSQSAPNAPGSLGLVGATPNFVIELTDPKVMQAPAGYGLASNLKFVRFTLTSTGYTLPTIDPSDPNPPSNPVLAQYAGQSIELARARITAGPF